MSIDIIRVRNGLVFAGVAGLGAGLAGMAAVALLVAPGVNLMQAWEVTASEAARAHRWQHRRLCLRLSAQSVEQPLGFWVRAERWWVK